MPNIEDKSMQDIKKGTQKSVQAVRKAKKTIKFLKFLKPALLAILPLLFAMAVIFLVVLVVFYAAPQGQLYTTTAHTEEDKRLLDYYEKIKDENNLKDRWLVGGESTIENTWYPKVISNNWNNNAEHYNKVFSSGHELIDNYGRDAALLQTFGQIHAGNIFYIISHELKETDDKFKAKIASDLRPYLYYKQSSITVCCPCEGEDCDPCSTSTVYLLVEAYTIQGHYLYEHEWVTEERGERTITYERPVGETQILPNKWQRLDDWVEENYELTTFNDIELLRTSLFEGAEGYTKFSEALEWLFEENVDSFYLSEQFIPVELLEYFEKVGEAFDIPKWFLAALAFKESSFNPEAINEKYGAFGLFQLTPSTQKQEVDKLIKHYPHLLPQAFMDKYNNSSKDTSFYREAVSDPYINTLCGALHLIGKGLEPSKIDWEGNWKEQTLPFLAAYGGYVSVPKSLWNKYNILSESEAKSKNKVTKWAKDAYATTIWENADKFSTHNTVYPTEPAPITAYYGQRGSYWANGHTGLDIGVKTGTPVYAVANADVVFAGWNGSYGNAIMINNGWYTFLYAHLSNINVRVGDKVVAGKIIGRSGNTGNSSGPHLHFEVRKIDGSTIDPLIWLSSVK